MDGIMAYHVSLQLGKPCICRLNEDKHDDFKTVRQPKREMLTSTHFHFQPESNDLAHFFENIKKESSQMSKSNYLALDETMQ